MRRRLTRSRNPRWPVRLSCTNRHQLSPLRLTAAQVPILNMGTLPQVIGRFLGSTGTRITFPTYLRMQGGQIAMEQMIVSLNNTGTNANGTTPLAQASNCSDAGGFPYAPVATVPNYWQSEDAPAQLYPNSYTSGSYNYTFQDYFMYQPVNDSVGTSIWVTLGTSTWGISASATNQNGTWTVSNPAASGTQPAAAYQLPAWTCALESQ